MDDSILECANGGCSFAKNSESTPDYSTSQNVQISPIYLGLEGIDYLQNWNLDITQNTVYMKLCTMRRQFGNNPFKTESRFK